MRLLPLFAGAVLSLAGAAAAAPLRLADVAGVYHREERSQFANGEPYLASSVLEVVPVSPQAAYVRTHLAFANGHFCSTYGVFDLEGPALVRRDPAASEPGKAPCVLRLAMKGGRIEFDDGRGTCQGDCGARGSWDGEGFPLSARRPIRYLPRLLASREYREATAAHVAAPPRR